jgi:hypothetical protein
MSLSSLSQPNRCATVAPIQTRLFTMNKIQGDGYSVANSSSRAAAHIPGGCALLHCQFKGAQHHYILSASCTQEKHINDIIYDVLLASVSWYVVPIATCGTVNCPEVEGGRCDH